MQAGIQLIDEGVVCWGVGWLAGALGSVSGGWGEPRRNFQQGSPGSELLLPVSYEIKRDIGRA